LRRDFGGQMKDDLWADLLDRAPQAVAVAHISLDGLRSFRLGAGPAHQGPHLVLAGAEPRADRVP
jgi:hypothetical protein